MMNPGEIHRWLFLGWEVGIGETEERSKEFRIFPGVSVIIVN
jgi:hypothetical protein